LLFVLPAAHARCHLIGSISHRKERAIPETAVLPMNGRIDARKLCATGRTTRIICAVKHSTANERMITRASQILIP
jgi:hypothetical protein